MTSEYQYYGSKGFTQPELSSRQCAYFGGQPGDIESLSDLRYAYFTAKVGPSTPPESINDLESDYYKALGGTGTLDDMREQFWSGKIVDPAP